MDRNILKINRGKMQSFASSEYLESVLIAVSCLAFLEYGFAG